MFYDAFRKPQSKKEKENNKPSGQKCDQMKRDAAKTVLKIRIFSLFSSLLCSADQWITVFSMVITFLWHLNWRLVCVCVCVCAMVFIPFRSKAKFKFKCFIFVINGFCKDLISDRKSDYKNIFLSSLKWYFDVLIWVWEKTKKKQIEFNKKKPTENECPLVFQDSSVKPTVVYLNWLIEHFKWLSCTNSILSVALPFRN